MKRFLNWLTGKFADDYSDTEDVLRQPEWHKRSKPPGRRPAAKKARVRKHSQYSDHVSGEIVDSGPGKNVLIRNKYVREDSGTHETLRIVNDSILDSDDEIGIDPYNTGRFDRSRSWDSSRSRK